MGCTAGDYDNDGAEDLAVSRERDGLALFHNEKNGTFKNMTEASGIGRESVIKADGENAGLTFIDYDHDGDVGSYVSRYYSDLRRSKAAPSPKSDVEKQRQWNFYGCHR